MATLGGRVSAWAVQTREVVYMAIGAALYGVLGYASSFLRLPGLFNTSIRPAIVIPMFFGASFGPWVGFFTGFVGNVIIDLLSGWGLSYWNWSLGSGILGFISGLAFAGARDGRFPSLRSVLLWAVIGNILAFFVASFLDIPLLDYTVGNATIQWLQAAGVNLVPLAILLPLLYVAYRQVADRTGR